MFFPPREIVERIKKDYPPGTRVELISMSDPYRTDMMPGLRGTVKVVDDTGTIHVSWENGSGLGVVYGEDCCRKLDTVKVICYGDEETWDSRKEAISFYKKAMASSEGSEHRRYEKIVQELESGMTVCTDDEA